jgi:1-acyl-sn-glycerol-3-phosphate acyltransferase
MLRRSFHAVRAERGGAALLASADAHPGPLLVALSHSSWWDPILGMHLAWRFTPSRLGFAPMDAAQLRRFNFFRRLGVFGIDPDSPESGTQMVQFLEAAFARHPRPSLWITPQGRFADPRAPLVVRPGAAAVAARLSAGGSGANPAGPGVRVLAVAVEYPFWSDRRPEVALRVAEVPAPDRPTTPAWTRALQAAMEANARALADLVIARDPAPFEVLLGAGEGAVGATASPVTARVHPVYDLWLRLRGRAGAVPPRREAVR